MPQAPLPYEPDSLVTDSPETAQQVLQEGQLILAVPHQSPLKHYNRRQIVQRALTNHCPRCGYGPIAVSLIKVLSICPQCQFKIDRGNGFFLGALPISYGLAVFWIILCVIGWQLRFFSEAMTWGICVIGAVLLPFCLYAYTRLMWLATYYSWVPGHLDEEPDEEMG